MKWLDLDVLPQPSPLYFESLHVEKVNLRRIEDGTQESDFKPFNSAPGSLAFFEDDDRPVILRADNMTFTFESKGDSPNEDDLDLDETMTNHHEPLLDANPILEKRSDLTPQLHDVDEDGTVDHVPSTDLEETSDRMEIHTSAPEERWETVKTNDTKHIPAMTGYVSTTSSDCSRSSKSPEKDIQIKGTEEDIDMSKQKPISSDVKEMSETTDSLPHAFTKIPRKQTPRRTYKGRPRKKPGQNYESPSSKGQEEEIIKDYLMPEEEAEEDEDELPVQKSRSSVRAKGLALMEAITGSTKANGNQESEFDPVGKKSKDPETVDNEALLPQEEKTDNKPARASKRCRVVVETPEDITKHRADIQQDAPLLKDNKVAKATHGKRKKNDDVHAKQHLDLTVPPKRPRKEPLRSEKDDLKETPRKTRGTSTALSSQTPTSTATGIQIAPDIDLRTTQEYDGNPSDLKIIFSNSSVENCKTTKIFLGSQKIKKVTNIMQKDLKILVVGTGELKKTSKLLLSIAMGKVIVEDQWLIDSQKAAKMLGKPSAVHY